MTRDARAEVVRAVRSVDGLRAVVALLTPPERHVVVRDVDPARRLDPLVRHAVLLRDDRTCKRCGAHIEGRGLHADHVIPWSAGGADQGRNLRTLCASCNQSRSNFVDHAEARTLLPVTWWCFDCWPIADEPHSKHLEWHYAQSRGCWLLDRLGDKDRDWLADGWWFAPPLDPPEMFAPTLAYCAHCSATNYTTRPM